VTMRLETPVVYFHPPKNWKSQPVDVHVTFRGGWLSEYYPGAIFKAPGLNAGKPQDVVSNESNDGPPQVGNFGHIKPDTMGELSWKGLSIGTGGTGPETEEKVWLAPRNVKAATVKTARGEVEKFLFYRGVANANASLRIVREQKIHSLKVKDNGPDGLVIVAQLPDPASARIHAAWLVEVRPDGSCAFKSTVMADFGKEPRATLPSSFTANDYSSENMARLKSEMRGALVNEGLFPDEADALLNTWEVSYFKSPGLRFFYICPRMDVDAALPLEISALSTVTRVMIGRIEIVTPEQRALLQKIATGPAPDLSKMRGVTADSDSEFFKHPENMANWNNVMAGKAPIKILGLEIPELYIDYLKLGRFRNALILDEQKHRPTAALGDFIQKNGFDAYKID